MLARSRAVQTRFDGCDMTWADCTWAQMDEAQFNDAQFGHTRFHRASTHQSEFTSRSGIIERDEALFAAEEWSRQR